jgi:CheY-like chemotaxis protein
MRDINSARTSKWSTEVERLLDRAESSDTHYEVLGLVPAADSDDIGTAYCRTVELIQPAREALRPSATEEFSNRDVAAIRRNMAHRLDQAFGRVVLAFSVLSNSVKRREYDAHLLEQLRTATLKLPATDGGANAEQLEPSDATNPNPMEIDPDRRSDRRLNLYIAAQVIGYTSDGGRWEEPAETVDASMTGLTFRIRRRVRVGTVVQLSLPLPRQLRMHDFDEPTYSVYALVRHAQASRRGVRTVGVDLLGDEPPPGFLERPWATFRDKDWDGADRRRKDREAKEEAVSVEYLDDEMRSLLREAARTENVSHGGVRLKVKSAPGDLEYARISYSDGKPERLAVICDRFLGKDNFERLCMRFLEQNEVAAIASLSAINSSQAIALGPPSAREPAKPAPLSAATHRAIGHPGNSKAPESASTQDAGKPDVQLLHTPSYRRVKILVADDDGPLRKTIGKILDTAGYEVMLAEDGKSAVTRAAAEKPDLIITDALMPGLHGFLVCKTVKEFSPAPRVIMLTAVYTKPGFKWEARDKYGADDLLTKPFKVPELLSAIETQLAAGMTGEPLGTW